LILKSNSEKYRENNKLVGSVKDEIRKKKRRDGHSHGVLRHIRGDGKICVTVRLVWAWRGKAFPQLMLQQEIPEIKLEFYLKTPSPWRCH
jgi:hypothetical protein